MSELENLLKNYLIQKKAVSAAKIKGGARKKQVKKKVQKKKSTPTQLKPYIAASKALKGCGSWDDEGEYERFKKMLAMHYNPSSSMSDNVSNMKELIMDGEPEIEPVNQQQLAKDIVKEAMIDSVDDSSEEMMGGSSDMMGGAISKKKIKSDLRKMKKEQLVKICSELIAKHV